MGSTICLGSKSGQGLNKDWWCVWRRKWYLLLVLSRIGSYRICLMGGIYNQRENTAVKSHTSNYYTMIYLLFKNKKINEMYLKFKRKDRVTVNDVRITHFYVSGSKTCFTRSTVVVHGTTGYIKSLSSSSSFLRGSFVILPGVRLTKEHELHERKKQRSQNTRT